ncbi:hypothetical protein GWK91_16315 [Virgibacillus sp. MSP4-1]|uniref:hypothetical protein n=1 Tax=Virgibacillus sp. MSP4-1 TaxID=2700081 RepID=UPI0005C6D110|nr:hypothetical protein [Virgibacillus sp. MSP4-1]QHS24346.1 hypothetical protein GWK91_16315 [Virgibacillus sp. MSP4-1]
MKQFVKQDFSGCARHLNKTWLANREVEIDDDVLIVKAQNAFAAHWLETKYKEMIFYTVKEVAGKTYEIEIKSNDGKITGVHHTQSERTDLHEKIKALEKRVEILEQQIEATNKMK